jgi:hypothetical protein
MRLIGVVAVALLAPIGRADATPPRQITVQGVVLAPSEIGLILRPNVSVSASDGVGVTSAAGTFRFAATFNGFPFEVRAVVDGVILRQLATTFNSETLVFVLIDPASESGVQILEAIGLEKFTLNGIEAVLSAVARRNIGTDYFRLSVMQAVALARRIAQDDPEVQQAIAQAMIDQQEVCVCDCDRSGTVTVDELVTGVNIALGRRPAGDCASIAPGTEVDVSFVVKAIRNALSGCL